MTQNVSNLFVQAVTAVVDRGCRPAKFLLLGLVHVRLLQLKSSHIRFLVQSPSSFPPVLCSSSFPRDGPV
jgi:hypothetical protein